MKKILIFGIFLMLLFAVPISGCLAAPVPVDVDIWINIENGGTAIMTTENNSPLPEESRITVDTDSTEAFHIVFTEAGTFSYNVSVEPDERDIQFDSTVYNIQIYVVEEDGVLHAVVVVYNTGSGQKYAPYDPEAGEPLSVAFANAPDMPNGKPVDGTDDPSGGDGGTNNGGSGGSSGSSGGLPIGQPKTGDDTMLGFYLIAAILASAGLFALSILYYIYVVKFVARRAR